MTITKFSLLTFLVLVALMSWHMPSTCGAPGRPLPEDEIASPLPTRNEGESLQDRLIHTFESKTPSTKLTDISYIRSDNSPYHKVDLYLPKRPKYSAKVPLVIWIHGGGYTSGDKQLAPAFLTDYGYAVASLNYRYSSEAHYPAQIWDCKAAVRFLRLHAKKYGIDPGRIGVWGHSSGGHLAALLGTTYGVSELEGTSLDHTDECSCVEAVVDWCGLTDLPSLNKANNENSKQLDTSTAASVLGRLLGGVPAKNKKLEDAASPVNFAFENVPPFLIMHGDHDTVVPIAQSLELFQVLKNHGVTVDMQVVKDGGHDFLNPTTAQSVRQFFDKWLKTTSIHPTSEHVYKKCSHTGSVKTKKVTSVHAASNARRGRAR